MRHCAIGRNEPGRPLFSGTLHSDTLFRKAIEALIEQLIALLDAQDGDPDLEPDCDGEPWLAGLPGWAGGWEHLDLELDETE